MNLSTYFQSLIANWTRGVNFPAAPLSITIGLSSTDPLVDGSGITEPVGTNGYARQTIALGAVNQDVNLGASIFNSSPITFGPVTNATWTGVQYVFIMDDAANMLAFGPMNTVRSLPVGDTFVLATNAIQLQFDTTFGLAFSNEILLWVKGTVMSAAASSLKLALSTANPLANMTGLSEPSTGDGYTRQVISFAAPVVSPGEGTILELANPVIFGPAVFNPWPQLTHGAILDQDNDLLFFGALASPRIVVIGDALPVATPTIKLLIR